MPVLIRSMAVAAVLASFAGASPVPAQAKTVCAWYAVAMCSKSEARATQFVNGGWGRLFVTSAFTGFPRNQFCVASGPQPKASALRDRAAALKNGVSKSVSVLRACADSKVFQGD